MKWLGWLRGNGEKLVLTTIAVFALVVAVLAIVTESLGLSHSQYLHDHVPSVMLALIATYILFFLFGFEHRIAQMKGTIDSCQRMVEQSRAGIAEHVRRWEALGITEIYRGRDQPGQKDAYLTVLRRATKDLFIVGVTLKDLTRDGQPTLLDKATAGCAVRLLMLTPERWRNEFPVLDPVASGDLKGDFKSALGDIRKLAITIAKRGTNPKPRMFDKVLARKPPTRRRAGYSFEVRFYDESPSLSMAVADGDLESGRMRVEFTPHNETDRSRYFRPMMDVRPVEREGMFEQFYLHYSGLWDKSKSYLCVSGSKIYLNAEFDAEASSMLGLPTNWLPENLSAQDTRGS